MATRKFSSSLLIERPSLGNIGRKIVVRANFFEVTSIPEANIHHYDITILPEVPPKLNRKIYQEFESLNSKNKFNGILPIYDGHKNIYTNKALPFGESSTFEITLPENDDSTLSKSHHRTFKIKIKKVNEINMEELQLFLTGKAQCTSNVLTAIMALDILIRHKPSMKYSIIGRSFFSKELSQSLSGIVEAWQGYYQSARPTKGRVMINIDLSSTLFYESGPLINIIVKILGKRNPDDLLKGFNNREHERLEKSLRNLIIIAKYHGETNTKRRYKIKKITPQNAKQTIFEANGIKTDVATYFKNTYTRLINPHLPCVMVNKNTFLPIEICEVLEGQRYIRNLNNMQTAEMIKYACNAPHIRANKIMKGLDILNYRSNEHMNHFGMKVSNEMTTIQARVLPTPTINYNSSSKVASLIPKNGIWNLADKKVAKGSSIYSWSVLVFGSERDYPMTTVQQFIRVLINAGIDLGMNIFNRQPPIMHTNPQSNIESSLNKSWIKAGNTAKAKPQLIICILPNTGVQLYGAIKYVGDTIIGVVTQCVQSRCMLQANKQYYANVCLKINAKLGGMNCFVSPNQIPFISDKPSILMGADVTHPSRDSNCPSIAALCASMDARASRYATTIRHQASRSEFISDLASMVKEMLKAFYQASGKKPERIIFYRDGISEGQFEEVLNGEVKAIKSACESLDSKYFPKVTFIIAQKRHHSRFFPINKSDSDQTGNCLAGTVVDTGVVHPVEFDFYLQSHPGLKGTCRPTHYHVLYDENKFTPDSIQTLSYYLCFTYARCTRAVSIVPPVYYAHLACSRARLHIQRYDSSKVSSNEKNTEFIYGVVKPELSKLMYFI